MPESYPQYLEVTEYDAGTRLDQFLVSNLPDVSRVRVQQLVDEGKITVNGKAAKPSLRLKGTEKVSVLGPVELPPLKATAEDIPLDVVYEDKDLAIINKPAGMLVHAGNANSDDPRNQGTLVNALLHRFSKLSEVGGELRPGIVHRLDKDTSGLLVVAKNDRAHRKLSELFSTRDVEKQYIALVHNWPKNDTGTINAPIGRDKVKRTRMSIRGADARDAVSHYKVLDRIDSRYGRFALVEVKIETGRTHQIRVHLSSLGYPVVGDTLYGAPAVLSPHTRDRARYGNQISTRAEAKKAELRKKKGNETATLELGRNFLHAAEVSFSHPKSKQRVSFSSELPQELEAFMATLREE